MSQPKVVGRRLGFWEGWDVKSVLILLLGPLFILLALRSFSNHGDMVYTVVLAALGVGATAFSIWLMVSAPSRYTVVSPCPVCGASDTRYFGNAADKKQARSIACNHCLAYLRVNPKTLEVFEESPNAVYNTTNFEVRYEQFWWAVPRRDDADHTFMLEMPAMCSVCCSTDAPFQEDIREEAPPQAVGGLVGAATWRASGNTGGTPDELPSQVRDRAVKHLKRPACERHNAKTLFYDAVTYSCGALSFESYAYYKEFCALNKITLSVADAPKFDDALPDAVARPAGSHPDRDQRTGT